MKPDSKPDLGAAVDRGETPSQMEPLVLSSACRDRGKLADMAVDLVRVSEGFRRSLPEPLVAAVSDLVRGMNCYYSNLIEGHNTHPVDIERALKSDYSADSTKRNLQLEARAHVEVQRWIDEGGARGKVTSAESIRDVHRRFCALLPAELLEVTEPETGRVLPVVGGELRREDVQVGRHRAISPGAVPRFLLRFEEAYRSPSRLETVLGVAAAHHRLLWIHPFLDGNGRVARLVSHATLLEALNTGGLWSVARGLARNVSRYKQHLAECDLPRRNDLDGRGALSEEALAEFTAFFLDTCLDQVRFMEGLMEPSRLRVRVLLWAEEESRASDLPLKAGRVLEALLYRGELPRGEVPALLEMGDRHARRIVSALVDRGVVRSETSRAPLRLALPATLASRFLPGLFPEPPAPAS